ncbi:hypothetical protein DBR32_04635 [Taibaiella sp. KBW10]|uniref:hypothetical protein n=1 Tax=Taibaiella sp. KBW10 TaxID=2153357 RepID=UPI000F5A067A|nr:hypothetical protein [Taibaiella sp. KBW10]RQO31260.1 hypothetical protein DBR32_04635 [Taibaiella sp. KBW10]
MRFKSILCLSAFLLLLLASCKKKTEEAAYDPEKSYFSIKQFIADQYDLKKGQPFVFRKYTTVNGKTDSAFVPYDEVDWNTIFKLFCATDISDNKYFDQYDFNNFDDNTLETSIMTYTAKSPDMFVQKFNVNYDNITGKIGMVYAETADNGRFHSKQQKLAYYVNEKIVIMETEKSLMSDQKEVMITYQFP